MQAPWSILKNFASSRNLSIQWIDLGDNYWLKAFDGPFSLECTLAKDGGNNQTDFETNFQSAGNQPLEFRSTDGLPKYASAMFTDTASYWVDGATGYISILAGQTGYAKTHFVANFKLSGVDVHWANSNAGDYINFEVGVYLGNVVNDETQFVQMAQFANEYRVMGEGTKMFEVGTVKVVPPAYNGLDVYIRTTYVNAGPNNATLLINLLGYK